MELIYQFVVKKNVKNTKNKLILNPVNPILIVSAATADFATRLRAPSVLLQRTLFFDWNIHAADARTHKYEKSFFIPINSAFNAIVLLEEYKNIIYNLKRKEQ